MPLNKEFLDLEVRLWKVEGEDVRPPTSEARGQGAMTPLSFESLRK